MAAEARHMEQCRHNSGRCLPKVLAFDARTNPLNKSKTLVKIFRTPLVFQSHGCLKGSLSQLHSCVKNIGKGNSATWHSCIIAASREGMHTSVPLQDDETDKAVNTCNANKAWRPTCILIKMSVADDVL